MAIPTTRATFKDYCLRNLGYPVIEINVDDDQIEDRIDDALLYYWDYHFDGSEKIYYKYKVSTKDRPGSISEIAVINGGNNYSNTDTVVITANGSGAGATANVVTNASGVIVSVPVSNTGTDKYIIAPTVTVTSGTGSGANLQAHIGGYIPLPDNILGAVRIFSVGDPMSTSNLFDIRYQIALNDLYILTNVSMIPYYMTFQHIQFLQELLVGQQPIRYNRHRNKLYVDMNWDKIPDGNYLVVEAYEIVDPDVYTNAWNDRWLKRYGTALIKRQWGANLIKFSGMQLPGGVQFNGEKIYNDAIMEIQALEEEMIRTYSLPVSDMIG